MSFCTSAVDHSPSLKGELRSDAAWKIPSGYSIGPPDTAQLLNIGMEAMAL